MDLKKLKEKIPLSLAIFSLIIILFSFLTPYLFTQLPSILDLRGFGGIGDALGGIMNPFIGIAGVLLTFVAFYVQYRTNQQQKEQFEEQLSEDKNQFKADQEKQRIQFRKNQFEQQFYEMLRLYKENVNEFEIELIEVNWREGNRFKDISKIQGRAVFKYMIEEIRVLYFSAIKAYKESSVDFCFNKAYSVFFHGLVVKENGVNIDDLDLKFASLLNGIRGSCERVNYATTKKDIEFFISYEPNFDLNYELGTGYSLYLGHYYRHLFQTVKFVVSQDEKLLTYEEKRNYLRILRAQLSNHEQAMLFYNWYSGFGKAWENETNKFFTDYRMIHNINPDDLMNDFDLKQIFKTNTLSYQKEKGREKDSLFEFEDWV